MHTKYVLVQLHGYKLKLVHVGSVRNLQLLHLRSILAYTVPPKYKDKAGKGDVY